MPAAKPDPYLDGRQTADSKSLIELAFLRVEVAGPEMSFFLMDFAIFSRVSRRDRCQCRSLVCVSRVRNSGTEELRHMAA